MQTFAKIILILVNIGFIVAGSLLIWFGVQSRNGHWSDIFTTGSATDVNTVGIVFIALGSLVILIALLGFAGAAWKNRCLLTTYSIFVILGLIIFIAITVLGFIAANKAKDWSSKDFPAESAENDVAKGFNEVYCYAQGARYCVSAPAKESISTFFPSVGDSTLSLISSAGIDINSNTGLIGFCDQIDAKISSGLLGSAVSGLLPSEYKEACSTCRDIKDKYGNYSSIFEWTNEKCPSTTTTAKWCGQFLLTKKQTSIYTDAPYKECRVPVLTLWKDYGNKVGLGGAILSCASLILVFLACKAARSSDHNAYHVA